MTTVVVLNGVIACDSRSTNKVSKLATDTRIKLSKPDSLHYVKVNKDNEEEKISVAWVGCSGTSSVIRSIIKLLSLAQAGTNVQHIFDTLGFQLSKLSIRVVILLTNGETVVVECIEDKELIGMYCFKTTLHAKNKLVVIGSGSPFVRAMHTLGVTCAKHLCYYASKVDEGTGGGIFFSKANYKRYRLFVKTEEEIQKAALKSFTTFLSS